MIIVAAVLMGVAFWWVELKLMACFFWYLALIGGLGLATGRELRKHQPKE